MIYQQLADALRERQPPPLSPTHIFNPSLSQTVQDSSDEELFDSLAKTDEQREMRAACRAGLLLMNDDIYASHEVSQSIETPTGSFWHAIMHRREGDFSNANYWWRRTGEHPAFADVLNQTESTLQDDKSDSCKQFGDELSKAQKWLPERFVALCEKAARENLADECLRKIQWIEMTALLNWCQTQV